MNTGDYEEATCQIDQNATDALEEELDSVMEFLEDADMNKLLRDISAPG